MKAEGPHNPPLARRAKIDLGGRSGKNSSDKLVKPV